MKRIQRKRTKGWKMPPNTVYVGRPTKWGNPWKVGVDGDLHEVLQMYKNWLGARLSFDPHFLDPLIGKDLACFCPLSQPCHADIILAKLEGKE